MTNQKHLFAKTKTRGEVEGSTAKIYRQKGTGRARHGAIRAPIFVGGGIIFGPSPRKTKLELPKKMKRAALFSALSSRVAEGTIAGLSGIDKATGKTKEAVELLSKIIIQDKKFSSALIVTDGKKDNIIRAVRNIPRVTALSVDLINAYEVLKHDLLLLTKEAVDKIGQVQSKEQKI